MEKRTVKNYYYERVRHIKNQIKVNNQLMQFIVPIITGVVLGYIVLHPVSVLSCPFLNGSFSIRVPLYTKRLTPYICGWAGISPLSAGLSGPYSLFPITG